MRLVVQRVTQGSVAVNGETRTIGHGLVILVGVAHGDTARDAAWLAEKSVNLRIFGDDEGKMNRSLVDVGGEALIISQFTLHGDCRKGRRPNFTGAAPPEMGNQLYEEYVRQVRAAGVNVRTGEFGAHMDVEIHNDGPVTLIVDSPA